MFLLLDSFTLFLFVVSVQVQLGCRRDFPHSCFRRVSFMDRLTCFNRPQQILKWSTCGGSFWFGTYASPRPARAVVISLFKSPIQQKKVTTPARHASPCRGYPSIPNSRGIHRRNPHLFKARGFEFLRRAKFLQILPSLLLACCQVFVLLVLFMFSRGLQRHIQAVATKV